LHLKEDNALTFSAIKTRRNDRVFTFLMKWLHYSCLGIFATAKSFLITWLVLWKLPDAVLVCYGDIPKPNYAPLSLSASIRFHLPLWQSRRHGGALVG